MSLESLLKAGKWADEQVLREYTKIAKRWEDKGRNIYHLSSALGIPAKAFIIVGGNKLFGSPVVGWGIELSLYNLDFAYNIKGLMGNIKEEGTIDGAVSLNPFTEFYKKINRSVRLPTLLSGAGLVGKSAYDFVNYFVNGEPFDNTTWDALTLGVGLVSIASSQYLKDRNPKLLDKQPFYETAYSWLKEKLSLLAPQPIPQPVPARAYSTSKD